MNLNPFSSSNAFATVTHAAERSAATEVKSAAEDPRTARATLVIPVVVGTRPEAIKMLPVILALRASESFKPVVVSTGQHHAMVKEILDIAGIEIEGNLWAGADRAELNERVSTVLQRFNDFIRERFGPRPGEDIFEESVMAGKYPATVLVHGDTSSAMAAALAATHKHIPVMHIEAGLRTGSAILSPFPEELNRQIITCLAAMHFAPTFSNLQALVRENVPIGRIFVTGNTGIDALHWAAALRTTYADPRLEKLDASDTRIVVVTAHRRENWGDGLANIATAIGRLAELNPDVHFVLPLHPNPRVREELGEPLKGHVNVLLTEPLDYIAFARLLRRCELVITDSGGIQEEAPSFNKPVLVMRETTERNEGVNAGTLLLVGTDADRIVFDAQRLLTDRVVYEQMAAAENPYGDGRAAKRIVAAMEHLVHNGAEPSPFGAGYDRAAVVTIAGFSIASPVADAAMAKSEFDAHHHHESEAWPL